MAKERPAEVRERSVRVAMGRLEDCSAVYAHCPARAPMRDVSVETRRTWVAQYQVDAGDRFGPTSEVLEEIRRLDVEVRDLLEANEILKVVSIFFARGFGPPRR